MLATLIDFKGILLVALVFIPLELIIPLHREQKILRKQWGSDVAYLFLNGILIGLGFLVVMTALRAIVHPFVPHAWLNAIAAQPIWLQVIEVLVTADVGFYLAHRMFHAVPMLWKFHAVHHSIEDLDWLAAHRVHPVDQAVTKALSYLPAFALGFSTEAILIFGLIYQWHSIVLHANTRISIGPLKWIIASPHFHHWHHADQEDAYDKNFGGQLSIFDYLLGTLHMPEGIPARYGSGDPVPPLYHRQLVYPLMPAASVSDTDAIPREGFALLTDRIAS